MKVLYIADIVDKYGATDSMMQMIDSLHGFCDIEPVLLMSKKGRLSKWADDRGYEYYCVGYKPFAIDRNMLKVLHIPNVFSKLFVKLYSLYCLAHEIKTLNICKKKIDFSKIALIHTNTNRINIGYRLSKEYKIPHVWHIREFGNYLDYDLIPLCMNYYNVFNTADKVICISEVVYDSWVGFGVDKSISTWIWDGIVSKLVIRKNEILSDPSHIKIVMAGYIRKNKGQELLVKAFSCLPYELKERIKIDFYGDYDREYYNKITNFIHVNKLEKYFSFCGYVENVNLLYCDYDIGIMCSNSEGLGRVTIDYMNNGCLVIASDSGSSKELIQDQVNGFLFDRGNAESLSNVIQKAIIEADLSRKIALKGKDFAFQNFSVRNYSEKIFDIYTSCITKKYTND